MMNKGLVFSVALLLAGCTPSNPKKKSPDVEGSLADYAKYFLTSEKAFAPQSLAAADRDQRAIDHNGFALSLYNEIAKEKAGTNIIYSPLSVLSAFALLYPAVPTESDLSLDMRAVMKFGTSDEQFSPIMGGFLKSIDTAFEKNPKFEADKKSKWDMNNALFVDESNKSKVQPTYLDTIKKHFNVGLGLVNFKKKPEEARKVINDFTQVATNNLVKDLLPENSITNDTAFVLLNTIYMLADWAEPFEKEATSNQDFTPTGKAKVSVPMMHRQDGMPYFAATKYTAVSLDYVSKSIAMMIVLPNAGETISSVLQDFTAVNFKTLTMDLEGALVNLSLPKFNYSIETTSLKDPLKALGMNNLESEFSPTKMFSTNIPLKISDVFHKAKIIVDEKGTEAAAATAIVGVEASANIDVPKDFIVNKPALYFIYEKESAAIIFMGALEDPSQGD